MISAKGPIWVVEDIEWESMRASIWIQKGCPGRLDDVVLITTDQGEPVLPRRVFERYASFHDRFVRNEARLERPLRRA